MSNVTARVRFYDDDINNIRNVQESYPSVIECIHVPYVYLNEDCSPPQPGQARRSTGENPLTRPNAYNEYLRRCGKWDLTGADEDLQRVIELTGNTYTEHVVAEGLNYMHVQDIFEWCNRLPDVDTTRGRIRGKLFLDWDQVVNHLEGVSTPRTLAEYARYPGLTASGLAKYCLGSRARYDAFRNLFAYLFSRNVRVYIVTNNGACRSRDPTSAFQGLAHELHPEIRVVCCRVDYSGHKGQCIRGTRIAMLAFGQERQRLMSFGKFQKSYKKYRGKKALQKFVRAYESLTLANE